MFLQKRNRNNFISWKIANRLNYLQPHCTFNIFNILSTFAFISLIRAFNTVIDLLKHKIFKFFMYRDEKIKVKPSQT